MMDDLTAFVRARLDEDEAAADAGARRVGMPWRAEPRPGTPGGLVIDELGLVGSTGGRYAAEHIARHDPARVLREVAAKRRTMGRHTPDSHRWCWQCSSDDTFEDWPCAEVRDIAAVWSDHPDYRQEWAR